MSVEIDLDQAIRKIPDFPKPGILFYDITGILSNPEAFRSCIEKLAGRAREFHLGGIAAVESRGFVFASPLALRFNVPLILLRKKGKLPGDTFQARFSLEYGEDVLEVHKSDVRPGQEILLVDDLIATGGTLKAACGLLEQGGARVAAIAAVIGLPFLKYEQKLKGYRVSTLINYHSE